MGSFHLAPFWRLPAWLVFVGDYVSTASGHGTECWMKRHRPSDARGFILIVVMIFAALLAGVLVGVMRMSSSYIYRAARLFRCSARGRTGAERHGPRCSTRSATRSDSQTRRNLQRAIARCEYSGKLYYGILACRCQHNSAGTFDRIDKGSGCPIRDVRTRWSENHDLVRAKYPGDRSEWSIVAVYWAGRAAGDRIVIIQSWCTAGRGHAGGHGCPKQHPVASSRSCMAMRNDLGKYPPTYSRR